MEDVGMEFLLDAVDSDPKTQMLGLHAVSGSGKRDLRKHETESAGVGNHHRLGRRSPHTESTPRPQDGRKGWTEPADGWETELSSLLGCAGAHGAGRLAAEHGLSAECSSSSDMSDES
ncbi:hypothetical protein VPH35_021115 [Triticum aestivum]|uniref:uncharacterized protein isoform X2 n=1 Tax=Triticum aestivum TaxID=4565 RepID=UPI001D02E63E|nr:uncharacterized protein LOC123188871 isoform X2 [Triticum aestivum]